MAGGGTQQSLRKALGAIKDSTKVGLAKVNSDYKELDVAIVKATNHVQRPSKEKYIQNIFSAISAARPRADVAYCIHALARRLAKTHNWAVALKTLIVIHRALREVDATFREELVNYSGGRSPMLNLAHFKDDSSPHAWDYSSWIRQYALFLEERLECFFVLKYDVETDYPSTAKGLAFPIKSMAARSAMSSADNTVTDGTPLTMRFFSLCVDVLSISATSAPSDSLFQEFSERTKDLGTMELLEQLSALQLLLFRLLACEPLGAAVYNNVVQVALSIVAGESVKIYNAICDGTINMIDKFFEMRRDDAVKALEIYRKAGKQAKQLSSFYELCKSLGLGRGERFPKIEQPPESFIEAMEEYVLNAPLGLIRKDQGKNNRIAPPKEVLALEYTKVVEVVEAPKVSPPLPEPVKVVAPTVETVDLLGLDDPSPVASDFDEKNAMALAIVPVSIPSTTVASQSPDPTNETTGWELALVTAPCSNESTTNVTKLGGGLDKLTLDSLYDDGLRQDALRRANQNASYNQWNTASFANMAQMSNDPFHASNAFSAPHNVQMAAMVYQQQAYMFQQQMIQQQMMVAQQLPQQSLNPFGNPYSVGNQQYGSAKQLHPHIQAYNPYASS